MPSGKGKLKGLGRVNAVCSHICIQDDVDTVAIALRVLLRLVDEPTGRVAKLPVPVHADTAGTTKDEVNTIHPNTRLEQRITNETLDR